MKYEVCNYCEDIQSKLNIFPQNISRKTNSYGTHIANSKVKYSIIQRGCLVIRYFFSPKWSQQTLHSSPARASYVASLVSCIWYIFLFTISTLYAIPCQNWPRSNGTHLYQIYNEPLRHWITMVSWWYTIIFPKPKDDIPSRFTINKLIIEEFQKQSHSNFSRNRTAEIDVLVKCRTLYGGDSPETKNGSFMMTSSNGNIFRVTGPLCSASLAIVRGIHRWPVNSPHDGQWRGALMFSLICALNKRLSKLSWGWWFETPKALIMTSL